MAKRLLGNGLLLKRPQEIEVGHGHVEEEVVGGCLGRVLSGGDLLAGDVRLKDRVGQRELGRHAGNRRRAAAHGIHPQSGFERRTVGHGDGAVAVLQRPVVVLVVDAGLY